MGIINWRHFLIIALINCYWLKSVYALEAEVTGFKILENDPAYFTGSGEIVTNDNNERELDIDIDLHQDLTETFKCGLNIIQKDKESGEWKPTVITNIKPKPCCKVLEKEKRFMKDHAPQLNLDRKCPISKGKYASKHFVVVGSAFPPVVPPNLYRLELIVFSPDDKVIFKAFMEAEVKSSLKRG